MKIIKKGTVQKETMGYAVSGFVVDCEGGPLDLPKFFELAGIPSDAPVRIKEIETKNPVTYSGNITILPKKKQ